MAALAIHDTLGRTPYVLRQKHLYYQSITHIKCTPRIKISSFESTEVALNRQGNTAPSNRGSWAAAESKVYKKGRAARDEGLPPHRRHANHSGACVLVSIVARVGVSALSLHGADVEFAARPCTAPGADAARSGSSGRAVCLRARSTTPFLARHV